MHKFVFLSLALLATACGSKVDDLESKRPTSSIATTDSDGVVTGTIDAAATSDQIMVASPNADAADSSVIFPPGSLAVSTEIAIGDASDQSSAILNELGVSPLATAGTAVFIAPAEATPPNVATPLTIQLPLPLDFGTTSLADGATSKLALLYVVYQDGWKSGLIPLTSESFVGAFLKQAVDGLGYFQIVYLPSAVSEQEATASSIVPALDSKVEDEQDEAQE